MKIAIVGGGFGGLSVGYFLAKKGHKVTVLEKSQRLGGLASGVKVGDWYIDRFYRHIFSSDKDILNLASEIDFNDWYWKKTNTTATYYNNHIYPFSGPFDLLRFSPLPVLSRLRTGIVSAYLKIKTKAGKLEKIKAHSWLKKWMGKDSYQVLWRPLLLKKFSTKYSQEIIASWLWARIYKRTSSLGYPKGGFENLANLIAKKISQNRGEIKLGFKVDNIDKLFNEFDRIVYTGPAQKLPGLSKSLPKTYIQKCKAKNNLAAMVLLVFYDGEILKENYWININASGPKSLVCVVNHTGFISRQHYQDQQVLYMGGYFLPNDKFYKKDKHEVSKHWLAFLSKIDPKFNSKKVKKTHLFKEDYAQPIMQLGYKEKILPFTTPNKKLFLLSMDQVYPFDRGVNYAVSLANDFIKNTKEEFE